MATETRMARAYYFSSGQRDYGTTDMANNPKIDFLPVNSATGKIKTITLTLYFTTYNFSTFDNYTLTLYLFKDGANMTSTQLADNSNAFASIPGIKVSDMSWPSSSHSGVGYIAGITLDISGYNISAASSITVKVTEPTKKIAEAIGYVYGDSTTSNLNTMIVEYEAGAQVYYGVNGEWKPVTVYYGVNGAWKEAQVAYGTGGAWKP